MKRNEYRTGAVPESLVQVILSKPGGTKERNIFALVALSRIRIRLENLVPAFSAVKMGLRSRPRLLESEDILHPRLSLTGITIPAHLPHVLHLQSTSVITALLPLYQGTGRPNSRANFSNDLTAVSEMGMPSCKYSFSFFHARPPGRLDSE